MGQALLSVENVSKMYPGVCALKDFSLSLKAKEFVVILGPSGCGKTTLLRLISGLETPTCGRVIYQDRLVQNCEKSRAYLFQEPRLFPWLTVEGNLCLAGDKASAAHILYQVGLSDFQSYYPHELSGGMAKRVALARVLMVKPELLLLDEPLANNDIPTKVKLQQTIYQSYTQGIGVIMVTHDLNNALAMASRIIILTGRPGRIIEDIEIDLPYPRNQQNPNYIQMKQSIIDTLKREVA